MKSGEPLAKPFRFPYVDGVRDKEDRMISITRKGLVGLVAAAALFAVGAPRASAHATPENVARFAGKDDGRDGRKNDRRLQDGRGSRKDERTGDRRGERRGGESARDGLR